MIGEGRLKRSSIDKLSWQELPLVQKVMSFLDEKGYQYQCMPAPENPRRTLFIFEAKDKSDEYSVYPQYTAIIVSKTFIQIKKSVFVDQTYEDFDDEVGTANIDLFLEKNVWKDE